MDLIQQSGINHRMIKRLPSNTMSPNWSVKRSPARLMTLPFSWALLVRCAPSGAAYLGRYAPHMRLFANAYGISTRSVALIQHITSQDFKKK